jgi:hypothetical protein
MWKLNVSLHRCTTPTANATKCNEMQRNATKCNEMQRNATKCNEMQRNATKCNEMQRNATNAEAHPRMKFDLTVFAGLGEMVEMPPVIFRAWISDASRKRCVNNASPKRR